VKTLKENDMFWMLVMAFASGLLIGSAIDHPLVQVAIGGRGGDYVNNCQPRNFSSETRTGGGAGGMSQRPITQSLDIIIGGHTDGAERQKTPKPTPTVIWKTYEVRGEVGGCGTCRKGAEK